MLFLKFGKSFQMYFYFQKLQIQIQNLVCKQKLIIFRPNKRYWQTNCTKTCNLIVSNSEHDYFSYCVSFNNEIFSNSKILKDPFGPSQLKIWLFQMNMRLQSYNQVLKFICDQRFSQNSWKKLFFEIHCYAKMQTM